MRWLLLRDDDRTAECGEFEHGAAVAVRPAQRTPAAVSVLSRAAAHRDREVGPHFARERRRIQFEPGIAGDREMHFAGERLELVAAAPRERAAEAHVAAR